MPVGASSLKLVVTFIKRFPLFPSQVFDNPLGSETSTPGEISRACAILTTAARTPRPTSNLCAKPRVGSTAPRLCGRLCPPLFLTDDKGVLAAPWMGEFRDLMVRKYGSLKAAEPRIRYIIDGIVPSMVERLGSSLLHTRTVEEQEQLEALIDRVSE